MKKFIVLVMAALLIGVSGPAFAASSVNQTVTYQVQAINEISVSGNPGALKATLTAPTGGTGAGQVTLTASAQDLVTGISTIAQSGIAISYEFSATIAAGVIASAQKTVTLTVADGV